MDVSDNSSPSSAAASTPDGILIVGYGKSGTKRLMGVFDLCRNTHCRSEPYFLSGSPWQQLAAPPRSWVLAADDATLLEREWDEAVQWCRLRMGELDRLPPPPKDHLYAIPRRLGLLHLLGSRKARRVLRFAMPALRDPEWLVPRWAGDWAALAGAIVVLRMVQAPASAVWALRHRPQYKVVHIVRHPAAVLHSWSVRFLQTQDADRVRRDNIERLKLMMHHDLAWSGRFRDVETMSVEESEMWFWAYATRVTHEAGEGQPGYELVLDERIALNPIEVASQLLPACGLAFNTQIETVLSRKAPGWRACTAGWRDMIDVRHVELIERILDGSHTRDWWEPNQIVSGFDYRYC